MKRTIETLKYMALVFGIGMVFVPLSLLLELAIGKVGVIILCLVAIFFLIRATIPKNP